MPWLLKSALTLLHLAPSIILNHTHPPDSNDVRRDMLLYAMVCGMVFVMLFPSLVCAVRDRARTTEVIVVTASSLALGWTAGMRGMSHMRPLVLQVVAAQVLWCLVCECAPRRSPLNYSRTVQVLASAVGLAHSLAHCLYDTSLRRVDVWLVAALFSGEVVGFAALTWLFVVREVGQAYEKAMNY